MSSTSIKILLVEDDELFHLGLRVRLQQEKSLEIIAEAEDGETALELLQQQSCDLVLLDIGLPGIGGIATCQRIKQEQPNLPVLILTSHSQKSSIGRLIEIGAQGYCVKGIPAEKLLLAIRSVAAGASWWDETATREIRSSFLAHPLQSELDNTSKSDNPLTNREREILSLVAAGKSDRQIAQELYITSGTVRVHIHTILNKLKVGDRHAAAIFALEQQLI
jgi:two-component system NarL family response regulator